MPEYRIDFGPGYRVYYGKDGEQVVILLGGREHETPEQGYSGSAIAPEAMQGTQAARVCVMPLSHSSQETIRARAQRDSEFRHALVREAVECIVRGDLATGKAVLQQCEGVEFQLSVRR